MPGFLAAKTHSPPPQTSVPAYENGSACAFHVGVDDPTLQRYLRARSGSIIKAAHMLAATFAWRSSLRIDTLAVTDFPEELASGKIYVAGHDHEGRPVMVGFWVTNRISVMSYK